MKVRMYCQVNENGYLKNIAFGEGLSVLDDFPFFFFIEEERAIYVAENMANFKVEIVDYKTDLVEQGAE